MAIFHDNEFWNNRQKAIIQSFTPEQIEFLNSKKFRTSVIGTKERGHDWDWQGQNNAITQLVNELDRLREKLLPRK